MAYLVDPATGSRHELGPQTLIGRASDADVVLAESDVSARHAEIRWTSDGWIIRDLASRNGTFLDGVRVAPGAAPTLRGGAELRFGGQAVRRLGAADAPAARAYGPDGVEVLASDGVIALPDADEPVVVLISGPRGWVVETPDGAAIDAKDGDVLDVAGRPWRVSLPAVTEETASPLGAVHLHAVELVLQHSLDEEHVELSVEIRGERHVVKPKAHHYTLLTLARARLEDAGREDLPPSERGWVLQSRLERMLGLGANALYQHVHRLRQEVAALGLAGSAGLIERRPGAGTLRVGVDRIVVRALE